MALKPMAEHIVSTKVYVSIFLALLVFTGITTAVAFLDLGPLNVVVALAIAFFKATLVVLFFMHVRYSTTLTKIVVAGGLLWLGIMIAFVLSDFATRGMLGVPGK